MVVVVVVEVMRQVARCLVVVVVMMMVVVVVMVEPVVVVLHHHELGRVHRVTLLLLRQLRPVRFRGFVATITNNIIISFLHQFIFSTGGALKPVGDLIFIISFEGTQVPVVLAPDGQS